VTPDDPSARAPAPIAPESDRETFGHSRPRTMDWPELVAKIRARSPARLLVGRVGASYPTATQLQLREDQAAARDAVTAELNLEQHLGRQFVEHWKLFEVSTQVTSKTQYLARPDLCRRLSANAHSIIVQSCSASADVQIVIGDGLSVSAVAAQVPPLLPLLDAGARQRGWRAGHPFVLRYCRVGVMNDIGDLLAPKVLVLLIGERPGMATAESLSAYMAYRPRTGQTDADRNLISNIHARGIPSEKAADRILSLAATLMAAGSSGAQLKESLGSSLAGGPEHNASPS
jgi:ethanolamine ammonia-lyase small subunit